MSNRDLSGRVCRISIAKIILYLWEIVTTILLLLLLSLLLLDKKQLLLRSSIFPWLHHPHMKMDLHQNHQAWQKTSMQLLWLICFYKKIHWERIVVPEEQRYTTLLHSKPRWRATTTPKHQGWISLPSSHCGGGESLFKSSRNFTELFPLSLVQVLFIWIPVSLWVYVHYLWQSI